MSEKTRNAILLVLASILIILAVATLVPFSISKTNDLGYFSACPMAPWSTLALLLVAGVILAIRQYFKTRIQ
jgi:hypothetical protein